MSCALNFARRLTNWKGEVVTLKAKLTERQQHTSWSSLKWRTKLGFFAPWSLLSCNKRSLGRPLFKSPSKRILTISMTLAASGLVGLLNSSPSFAEVLLCISPNETRSTTLGMPASVTHGRLWGPCLSRIQLSLISRWSRCLMTSITSPRRTRKAKSSALIASTSRWQYVKRSMVSWHVKLQQ